MNLLKTNNKKAFIFDFDGTIGDTFYTIIGLINKNPSFFGIDGIDPSEVGRLRSLSPKYLIKEFNLSILKLPYYIRVLQKQLYAEIPNVPAFPGVLDVAKELKKRGCFVSIITSNSSENVEKFMQIQNCTDLFSEIVSEKSYFSKASSIKKVVEKFDLDSRHTFYIGDEVRDVISAKKASVKSVAVDWGFNTSEILKSSNPDYLISSASSLIDIYEEDLPRIDA